MAVLIAIVLIDTVVARHHAHSSWCFCLVQAFTLLMGCLLAVGLLKISHLPWNRALYPHLIYAFQVLGCGYGLSIGNAVSLWILSTVSLEGDHRCDLWHLRVQASCLVLSSLTVLIVYLTADVAFRDFDKNLQMAKVDFYGYCTEKYFDALSAEAVLEWLYVIFLFGGISSLHQEFQNIRQDMEIWCSADSRKPLLPRSTT